MGAMMSLARKEMEESLSSYLLGTVALVGFTVIGLESRLIPDLAVLAGGGFGAVILTMLTSMGLTAPERADGSILSLRALPVRATTIMLVKLTIASLMIVSVIATAGAAAILIAGGREVAIWHMTTIYTGTATMAVALLAWMVAFNVRIRGEGAAGLISIGVLIALVVITGWIVYWALPLGSAMKTACVVAWLPWSMLMLSFDGPDWAGRAHTYLLLTTMELTLTTAALWLVSMWRFARLERSRG